MARLAVTPALGVDCFREENKLTQRARDVILCMTLGRVLLRIADFEWDEGNTLHLELRHGLTAEEAEEVFANRPLYRRTQKKHYVAFGPTFAGRYLTIVFEWREKGLVRVITGWDMKRTEIQYYRKHKDRG